MSTAVHNDNFDLERFVKLPWNIIRDILNRLPKAYIYEAFIEVPALRANISKEFFSKIGYKLRNTQRKDLWSCMGFTCFKVRGLEKVDSFLSKNPDIIPQDAYLSTANGMDYIRPILMKHMNYFQKAPKFHLELSDLRFSDSNFELIRVFQNLKTLRMNCPKWNSVNDLSKSFKTLECLDSLSMLYGGIEDWSDISFPRNLTRLEVSSGNLHTVNFPSTVNYVQFCGSTGAKLSMANVKFPELLSDLQIQNFTFSSWSLSNLPKTLKRLRLINCNLGSAEWNNDGAAWPPGLEAISLKSNSIANERLSLIIRGLPPCLRNVNLSHNGITQISYVKLLPKYLERLDLSWNPITTFADHLDEVNWPVDIFPKQLLRLNLSSCYGTLVDNHRENKIRLPNTLLELNLHSFSGILPERFYIPKSLVRLSLSGLGVDDLSIFDKENSVSTEAESKPTFWETLKNLKFLDLSRNKLESLKSWNPPPNIVRIDLRRNQFSELSASWPLFDESCVNRLEPLRYIDLSRNKISKIDAQVHLPPGLTSLNLCRNHLNSFTFTDGIVSEGCLNTLSLRSNSLRIIQSSTTKKSNIRKIDLSLQKFVLGLDVQQMDEALEAMGLMISEKVGTESNGFSVYYLKSI